MKFNKNEFGWKEKVSVNTNLNNDTFNIKFLPDMNTNSRMYIVNIVDLEENTTYRVNMNSNKKSLSLRYIFSDGTFKNLYNLSSKYLLGKVEIYIYRKTDTLIEFDVDYDKYIRYTCNIDEVNKTVEITKKALILNTDNKQEYTPTLDYHPATKKYVDSKFYMYENIETIYTIPMSEMQKCNNGTSMYVSNINFDELFINHEKYIYYANYKDDTLIPVTYDSTYNRFVTDILDDLGGVNLVLGFDLGTHKMYPFNGGSVIVKAYTFTNDLVIKRVPILDVNEVATKNMVNTVSENNIFKNTQMNNMLSSLTIGGSLSTGLTKSKTLGEVFPKLLNEEYGVLKQCYVTVEVDETTKPILTENYNNVLIQLYDNDNNLISSTSLRPKKVGTIYFNANEFMQMAVWFDTTYTEGSGLSHNTPGYVTSLLNITANKNTEEYINAIKDLRVSVTLRHTNYLPKDNTVVYEPTSDYNPATKKYVDDSIANIEITGGSNINDTTASANTTYSSNKIESIKENLSSQIKDIEKQVNKFYLKVYSEDGTEHILTISNNNELLLDGNKIGQGETGGNQTLEDLLDNRILLWHDEFDGDSLDETKWTIQVEGDDETHRNNEVQAYLAGNVSIDTVNKNLVMTAKKETYTGDSNIAGTGIETRTYDWTSGSVHTNDKMEFLYGRLEMKAKMPCVAGTWPAFWLLNHMFPKGFYGNSWCIGGEIDIFEQYNTRQNVVCNLWQPTGNDCVSLGTATYSCNPSEWHIYAFEWTENSMELYVDGNLYKTYDTTDITCSYNETTYYPFKMAQQIKLNMALGSTAGSCTDDTNGAEYRIAWIRLYAPESYSNEIKINSIQLDKNSLNMSVGNKDYIFASVSPITATNQTIAWESSDDTVATVRDGCITPIKAGECNIIAKANGNIATCAISVGESIACTNIALDVNTLTINENSTYTLSYTLTPLNCTDRIQWESSDPTKLSVKNGVLTPYANGDFTITVTCGDQSDSCNVTVNVHEFETEIVQTYTQGQNIDLTKYSNNSAKYFEDGVASISGDTLSLISSSTIYIEYIIDGFDANTSYKFNVSFGGSYKAYFIYDENDNKLAEIYKTNYVIIPEGFSKFKIRLYCGNTTTSYSAINFTPYTTKNYFTYSSDYTLEYTSTEPTVSVNKGIVYISPKESKTNSVSWIINNLDTSKTYKFSTTTEQGLSWMAVYKKDDEGNYTTLINENSNDVSVTGNDSYKVVLYAINGNSTIYSNVLFQAV